MSERPAPLVPAEVDLRDFQGMWVDTDRLLRSDTWILGTSDEKAAAFTLWAESWHQVPAASLPSNDRVLQKLSQAEKWKASREHALRGWVHCSDDRLYHPVVAEKALEAWIKKLAAAISGAIGNSKRWQVEVDTEPQRRQFKAAVECLRALNPTSRVLKEKAVAVILAGSPPDVGPPSPPESPPDDAKHRPPIARDQTGPDQTIEIPGESKVLPPPPARAREDAPPPEANGHPPTLAGAACIAIRQAGIAAVNPGHPDLLRLLDAGVTPQVLADTAAELVGKRKGSFPLLLATVEGRLRDAAAAGAVPAAQPDPMAWRKSVDGVIAKGRELGMEPRADELIDAFERRVLTASQRRRTAAPPPNASTAP